MKNITKQIYLQIGDDCDCVDFTKLSNITWCVDKIHYNDLGYVLYDNVKTKLADYEKLKSILSTNLLEKSRDMGNSQIFTKIVENFLEQLEILEKEKRDGANAALDDVESALDDTLPGNINL